MSVASSENVTMDTCTSKEISNLLTLGLEAGATRRMSCLKCVIRGAEVSAGIDKTDNVMRAAMLESQIKALTERLQSINVEEEFLND